MAGPGTTPDTAARERARAVDAWCLYDVANSAFATSVVAAILPVYFAAVAARTMPANLATAKWGYASALAMLGSGIMGPLLGAWADRHRMRKKLLGACVVIGTVSTAGLALVPSGHWFPLLALFALAFLTFAVGNALYDSLLPAVAEPADMHRVSARGFAWGYWGGGVLLAVNLAWILWPRRFGLHDVDAATRLSFASVAVWWLGFSIPLLRRVQEPAGEAGPDDRPANPLAEVWHTLRGLRARPELLRFLIAFWLYSDGIGTIVKMATVYGSEVGIGRNDLIGSLLMVQFVAAPASLAFGRLARTLGPQRSVAIGLAGYVGITVLGFYMTRPLHFWMLAALVALFQGGTQALSRSMFASLVPRRRMSELFGFYSVSEKLSGVIGPLLFAVVAQVSGKGRFAVLTLMPFFIGGAWLLLTVDLDGGRRRAQADDATTDTGS
ncbi:MAG: MFS transporter [Candidatus Eisenbacteria bacterium]